MSELKLYLFGEPKIEQGGSLLNVDRRKAFALLAYLTVSEQRQNRDVLTALLWPDLEQERAHAALRTTIHALSALVEGDWLDRERTTLALNHEAIWTDVTSFQTLMRRSRVHKHEANILCVECANYLYEAVALYREDFMLGFSIAESAEYDEWQTMQREWLRRELSYALRRLAVYSGEMGDFETALGYANRWLGLDPLHEPAHRILMRLYAASGQRAEAIRQYHQCVEILDIDLATPPEEETNQLYAAIQAESTLPFTAGSPPVTPKTSIVPTLPSLVIGRAQALTDLKGRLGIGGELRPLTVIQGWPGVGKSTTVAALAHDPQVTRAFPDGILWASLGENPSLLSELVVWAEALGLSDPSHERKVEVISSQIAALLRERHMLLIVDDVWQVEHAAPFKVGGQACATILTSRLNDVAQALAPTAYDMYRLSVLSEDAGLELLSRLTPEMVTACPDEARELVRDLEGLPLAIQVAGRLLHSEACLGWGVINLLQELRSGAALLQAQAPGDMVKLGQENSPTITALLKRSTDSLDEDTRRGFALLGLLVPKPATFDLGAMSAAWDVPDPKPMARVLVNRGLLEPVSGGRFQMHALLVLHARSLLETMVG
jgi:DNA-binding SARP family transcriptional activator